MKGMFSGCVSLKSISFSPFIGRNVTDISKLFSNCVSLVSVDFANFGSIAIQLGGIGELAPNQRKNLARLGVRALICGTLTGYMSAAIAGIMF